ncbi:phage tail protein [Humidesulfovibrio sp.]
MAEYYMILTVAGQAAYARAGAGGSPVQISAVAVGDGGGVAVQPAESWVSLVGEVWRGAPTLVEVDAANPRLVLVEAHVPHNAGGWYAREIGLLSPDGVLLAVGNYPESYKPVLDSGVGKELMIRAYIEHGNASQTTLKINPDIVMASRTYVVSAVAAHDASPTAHAGQLAGMTEHIDDLANPHQVTAAQAGAEPQGAVAGHNSDEAAHGDIAGRILAAVAGHNESGNAHADIRAALAGINIPAASEAVAGVIKQSTAAQALAGTDDTTAMSPADVAAAIAGVVRAYTRQQYAAPVVCAGASGAQAVDLDLHPLLFIDASGALTVADPEHMTPGKTCVLLLYSAAAQTISWGTAWRGTSLAGLPTALAAGKLMLLSFLCVTTPAGTYMVPMGIGQEA